MERWAAVTMTSSISGNCRSASARRFPCNPAPMMATRILAFLSAVGERCCDSAAAHIQIQNPLATQGLGFEQILGIYQNRPLHARSQCGVIQVSIDTKN